MNNNNNNSNTNIVNVNKNNNNNQPNFLQVVDNKSSLPNYQP